MRLVFKVGTSLVTTPDNRVNSAFIRALVGMLAKLHATGHELVLVTSGAVASGRMEMSFAHEKKTIPYRQALAAIGQGILMKMYYEDFKKYEITVAQALLTNGDFTNRKNFLNTRSVFDVLLEKRVIPIVNENDVTTIDELKFGDNDMLSAKTAAMISADYLVILTDVDGLFDGDPRKNPEARLLQKVPVIDEKIRAGASGAAGVRSRGGMLTKVEAAAYATSSGVSMCIINGTKAERLSMIVDFFSDPTRSSIVGTFFPTPHSASHSRKKWLKPKIQKNAALIIDEGAAEALRKSGRSLLPSGVCAVEGKFKRGDVVSMKCGGDELGYGQVNYDADEIDKIKKHRSNEIEGLLGYSFEEELIHRDHMVIFG